ncbi:MAG TPA: MarC family transcriptional regulator [Gammaproteobacteria bacterium]|nr:MarC family transcriptional regulator [Gammaproteobacteria bacterium]
MENPINSFIVLFSVVDPIGVAWLFAAMTKGTERSAQRKMALRATLFAGGILLLFLFSGTVLLDWFGITIPAFRIAGGVLLFLLSIDMIFARHSGLRSTTTTEQAEAIHKQDVSVFPLAFPLLAGPGAITTVLLSASASTVSPLPWDTLLVLVAVLFSTLIALLYAPMLTRSLGETGANVVSRLLGLLLAALAVQYIIDGIIASFLAISQT